jgi:hypothetical protein
MVCPRYRHYLCDSNDLASEKTFPVQLKPIPFLFHLSWRWFVVVVVVVDVVVVLKLKLLLRYYSALVHLNMC